MNERINQLRLEAGISRLSDFEGLVVINKAGQVIDSLSGLQKFAESIVAECMDCATWVGKMNDNPVPPANTAHAIKIRMSKHFGIE